MPIDKQWYKEPTVVAKKPSMLLRTIKGGRTMDENVYKSRGTFPVDEKELDKAKY